MKLTVLQLGFILVCLIVSYGSAETTKNHFNTALRSVLGDLDSKIHHYFCAAVNNMLPTKFILRTRENGNFTATANQLNDLFDKHLDPKKEVLIIVHEYLRGCDKPFTQDTTRAYFHARPEVQVVTVCWDAAFPRLERYVGKFMGVAIGYWPSTRLVPCVGDLVAKFLNRLHHEIHVPWDRMSIVTHSLGCQLAGDAGNKVGGKLGKIIALDPAVPFFAPRPLFTSLLSKNSAKHVIVLHTSVFQFSMGTADFYANILIMQPGCEEWLPSFLYNPLALPNFLLCSHSRSFQLFIESVFKPDAFLATECANYAEYRIGLCSLNNKAYFGPDTEAIGTYYFSTTGSKPYY